MENEINSYEQQANDFLQSTNATITPIFDGKKLHFGDDKEPRDIYDITLERGEKVFIFKFGQSMQDSEHWAIESKDKLLTINLMSNVFMTQEAAKEKIKEIQKEVSTDRHKYIVATLCHRKAPTSYDIITCLTKSDPGTFENFCSDFGYDTDSRKAFKIYHAVLQEYKQLSAIFTEEELEKMAEIQ